jgi:hypothetical protein
MPLGRRPVARGIARTAVVAGTASAVAGRVHHHQNEKWAAQEQQAAGQPQYYEPEPAAPVEDEATQLRKIAELHTQGILTDEEFAAKKAQILGL